MIWEIDSSDRLIHGMDRGRPESSSGKEAAVDLARLAKLDLTLVLALDALLAERSVTRAGRRIGLSQPAMSAALARLRRHFGDDLLEREGRGYKRTVFGEQLLPAVREALWRMEATMQRSPRFDPAESDRE